MAGAEATLHGAWPTVGALVDGLDRDVLHVIRAGAPDATVRDVVIVDATDPHSIRPDVLLLAVGSPDPASLIEQAVEAGAAGVVFRTSELPREALARAEAGDLALLCVPPVMPWGQVYMLLRTAAASVGARGSADAAGVPLGDLFALADAIAADLDGPVTIEDPQMRVLAFSNLGHEIDEARRQTILGRGVSPDWQRRLEDAKVAQALRSGDGAVRFTGDPEDGLAPRLAAPVRAGSELLGAVWIAEADAPLDDDAEAALERAAEVAAIHLVYHRAADDLRRRTRGAFVREVLEGRVPQRAAPLRAKGPFVVVVFETVRDDDARERVDPERLLSVVSLYCEDAHPDAMCAFIDDRFWALMPLGRTQGRERIVELANRIAERAERALGAQLIAGVGRSVAGVAEVPDSRRAAEQALTVLVTRNGGARVADIEQVRAHAALLELLRLGETHPELLSGKVADLIAADREDGARHAATLRVYLDAWGDMARAASTAGVHVNTMRYRVRKALERSGIDLDDPAERLVTELQLRLHAHADAP